jgi:hypothetical protein
MDILEQAAEIVIDYANLPPLEASMAMSGLYVRHTVTPKGQLEFVLRGYHDDAEYRFIATAALAHDILHHRDDRIWVQAAFNPATLQMHVYEAEFYPALCH